MPNSDIHIGWVDDYGNVFLQDRYTTARATPLYDSHQNLTVIEGEESDGMTRIRFKRNKYTCNEEDVQLSQGTTRYITIKLCQNNNLYKNDVTHKYL